MEDGYKVIKRRSMDDSRDKTNNASNDENYFDVADDVKNKGLEAYYHEEGLSKTIKEHGIYGITKEEIEKNKQSIDLSKINERNKSEEYKTVKRRNSKNTNHEHTEKNFSSETKKYIIFIGSIISIILFIIFLSLSDKDNEIKEAVVVKENPPPTSTFVIPNETKYDDDKKVEEAIQELQKKYSEKEDRTLLFIELKERYEEDEANRQITDEEILFFYN